MRNSFVQLHIKVCKEVDSRYNGLKATIYGTSMVALIVIAPFALAFSGSATPILFGAALSTTIITLLAVTCAHVYYLNKAEADAFFLRNPTNKISQLWSAYHQPIHPSAPPLAEIY